MRLWRVDSYQADNLLDAHRVLRSNVVAAVDLAVKMIASASFARWPQLGGSRWNRQNPSEVVQNESCRVRDGWVDNL